MFARTALLAPLDHLDFQVSQGTKDTQVPLEKMAKMATKYDTLIIQLLLLRFLS